MFEMMIHTMLHSIMRMRAVLEPVYLYTIPDPYGHDMKLKSLNTNVAHEYMTILENFITTNHRQRGKSKYDRKLTELDVVIK